MRFAIAALALALSSAAPAAAGVEGDWVAVTDMWGNRLYETFTLDASEDGAVSGTLGEEAIAGTLDGDTIALSVSSDDGTTRQLVARLDGDAISGTIEIRRSGGTVDQRDFTARRIPDRPGDGAPRVVDFDPSDFSNQFSADRPSVLTIWPGDTVRTRTIDSGGIDEHGGTVALYGNPQTGPFFIAGARPGDILVVRLDQLRPNRDYADSLDMIVGRAQTRAVTTRAGELGRPVRWRIDSARGVAVPEQASERMRDYSVPLRPMLGGIAVAPGFGFAPPSTGETGRWGGNIDFNEITEGSTVYLPVQQPGALLYIGDAHAAQGDGETSQFALETSMDVTFTVDILLARVISGPRVETDTEITAIGQAGTMEDATRIATAGLIEWLEQDYGLTLSEIALILGTAARYTVVTLAGQNVGMAARLPKARLEGLIRITP